MLTSTTKRTAVALICSFMFVASALAPSSYAGKPDAVVVVDYEVAANVVLVTVKNNTHKPQNVEVHVYATVNGEDVRGFTPVSLSSNGTAETVVGFIQTIESVETVGIVDESHPQ